MINFNEKEEPNFPRNQYRFFQRVCLNDKGQLCIDDELKTILFDIYTELSDSGNTDNTVSVNGTGTTITNNGDTTINNNGDTTINNINNCLPKCAIDIRDITINRKPYSFYPGITIIEYRLQPSYRKDIERGGFTTYKVPERKVYNLSDPLDKAKIACRVYSTNSLKYQQCVEKQSKQFQEYFDSLINTGDTNKEIEYNWVPEPKPNPFMYKGKFIIPR